MQGQWAVTASGSRVESLLAKTFPLLGLFLILGAETGIFIFYYRQNDGLLAPDTEGFNRFFVCVCVCVCVCVRAMNIWNWMEKNVWILYILPRWLEIKVTPPWNSVPEACTLFSRLHPAPSCHPRLSLAPCSLLVGEDTGEWWFCGSRCPCTSFLSCNCFPLTLTASP